MLQVLPELPDIFVHLVVPLAELTDRIRRVSQRGILAASVSTDTAGEQGHHGEISDFGLKGKKRDRYDSGLYKMESLIQREEVLPGALRPTPPLLSCSRQNRRRRPQIRHWKLHPCGGTS